MEGTHTRVARQPNQPHNARLYHCDFVSLFSYSFFLSTIDLSRINAAVVYERMKYSQKQHTHTLRRGQQKNYEIFIIVLWINKTVCCAFEVYYMEMHIYSVYITKHWCRAGAQFLFSYCSSSVFSIAPNAFWFKCVGISYTDTLSFVLHLSLAVREDKHHKHGEHLHLHTFWNCAGTRNAYNM